MRPYVSHSVVWGCLFCGRFYRRLTITKVTAYKRDDSGTGPTLLRCLKDQSMQAVLYSTWHLTWLLGNTHSCKWDVSPNGLLGCRLATIL